MDMDLVFNLMMIGQEFWIDKDNFHGTGKLIRKNVYGIKYNCEFDIGDGKKITAMCTEIVAISDEELSAYKIAQKELGISTLTTQNRDCLDFHDLSVWSIKEALMMAYRRGYDACSEL